jgi:hypothetical protein
MRAQQTKSRAISAIEVAGWFGNSSKLTMTDYETIAARLNRMRWPSDPSDPPDAPWLPKEPKDEPDRWWDFHAVFLAAKTLSTSLPAMRAHWDGLQWDPTTKQGYDAICALEEALCEAMEFVEFPFGQYKRRKGGRKTPKEWHLPSVLMANLVIETLMAAGHPVGGTTRNSVIVRVVHKALLRMGFPDSAMRTPSAIGAHLTRWHQKCGLSHVAAGDDHKAAKVAL